jgi:hypothetical protein
MQRHDHDKKLIQLHKEEMTIWKEIRNLGWTELKPPVQRGFIRYFILRDDVTSSKHAPFFQKILEKINSTLWSSKKDFKKKRRKFGKKIYVVREQNLRDVSEKDLFSNKFTEHERAYFYEALTHPNWSKQPVKIYRFNEPWRFVLRIQPNMITKVRVKSVNLEIRSAEIKSFLDVNNRRFRLSKLLHGNNRWKYECKPKGKYKNQLQNKSFSDILNECIPETKQLTSIQTLGDPGVFFLIKEAVKYTELYAGIQTHSHLDRDRMAISRSNFFKFIIVMQNTWCHEVPCKRLMNIIIINAK